jgi:hypothetical protein
MVAISSFVTAHIQGRKKEKQDKRRFIVEFP